MHKITFGCVLYSIKLKGGNFVWVYSEATAAVTETAAGYGFL